MTKPKHDRSRSIVKGQSYVREVMPPGETIKNMVESRDVDLIDLAYELKLSQNDLNDLLIGELLLTTKMAQALERIFGVEVSFWLDCETEFRRMQNGE